MKKMNQKNYVNLYIKFFIIILYLTILTSGIIFVKKTKLNFNFNNDEINLSNSSYSIFNELFFNISSVNYYFSHKYNKIELEYHFQFFDKQNNFIFPSDLALYYNLHVFCILKSGNISLQSLPNIHQNKYFTCLEYNELNLPAQFEIKICKDSSKCISTYIFDTKIVNYNFIKFVNNDKFDLNYINEQYSSLYKKVQDSKDDLYLLKKCYISHPIYFFNEKAIFSKNNWYFNNIYNHYFCFCYGNDCKADKNFDICKYYFYLSIIDDNQYLYKKTYYLFADFLLPNRAPGDAYFVFREMVKKNLSAFYLTGRKDIYKEYYESDKKFQRIIPIINNQKKINGNILEKYLTLFLKLKCVISGSEFYSKENIFFKIHYLTFICLGHGVNFFKPFLYKDYYGCQRYNKILLPSEKIISIAKQYGWKEKNIIKLGLPKWDLFNDYSINIKNKTKEKCIFIMFTWRKLKKNKKISPEYFNNLLKLLQHAKLNQILFAQNITLYISLHHNLLNKRNKIKNNHFVKYIKQEDILNCIMKCDLVISDFSSIIFDFMYRQKPFIIFIPDSNDTNLYKIYDNDYLNIINGFKNGSIEFENKFFETEEVIKKIEYYVSNHFQLDEKLQKFYKTFNLNNNNNINRFIEYLKSV